MVAEGIDPQQNGSDRRDDTDAKNDQDAVRHRFFARPRTALQLRRPC
jgi:hypothetical protein